METILDLLRRGLADDATAEQRAAARTVLDQLAPLVASAANTPTESTGSPSTAADPVGHVIESLITRLQAAKASRQPAMAPSPPTRAPLRPARERPIPFIPAQRRRP